MVLRYRNCQNDFIVSGIRIHALGPFFRIRAPEPYVGLVHRLPRSASAQPGSEVIMHTPNFAASDKSGMPWLLARKKRERLQCEIAAVSTVMAILMLLL
jgi:hypothetical protein